MKKMKDELETRAMNTMISIPSHKSCFACGRENESGLNLEFSFDDRKAHCAIKLDRRFQSYPGIVHGGILASIADSAMVNLAHRLFGGEPKTCRLDLRIKKSIIIDNEIRVEAELSFVKNNFIWALCTISDSTRECVVAKGILKI
jgi:acyl-coenzyme A thioesterase PaaI-like protein